MTARQRKPRQGGVSYFLRIRNNRLRVNVSPAPEDAITISELEGLPIIDKADLSQAIETMSRKYLGAV